MTGGTSGCVAPSLSIPSAVFTGVAAFFAPVIGPSGRLGIEVSPMSLATDRGSKLSQSLVVLGASRGITIGTAPSQRR